jgi:hypothetical protein
MPKAEKMKIHMTCLLSTKTFKFSLFMSMIEISFDYDFSILIVWEKMEAMFGNTKWNVWKFSI